MQRCMEEPIDSCLPQPRGLQVFVSYLGQKVRLIYPLFVISQNTVV